VEEDRNIVSISFMRANGLKTTFRKEPSGKWSQYVSALLVGFTPEIVARNRDRSMEELAEFTLAPETLEQILEMLSMDGEL
jgi:hypothetical protein